MINSVLRRCPDCTVGAATVAFAIIWNNTVDLQTIQSNIVYTTRYTLCEDSATESFHIHRFERASWFRRNIMASVGIPLPVPRLLTQSDPALTLPKRYRQRRLRDESRMRQLLEEGPAARGDPEKLRALQEQICEVAFGKGVTAQMREDFLVRYGCTGWTDQVLDSLLDLCESRGMVEMGAGHGQWARALTEAYEKRNNESSDPSVASANRKKRFDFCLAYDDMSDLPLNTHIYNAYTQPHHDYFGTVHKLEPDKSSRVLQSWACRGRVLLLVYPPPGDMALTVVQQYVEAAPENDTVVFVGEGRGGGNGNEALFDYFEQGDWVLLKMLDVERPPGDKGYEKLFVLKRRHADERRDSQ